MGKLKLKLESARNGKSWNDIESVGNNEVSGFTHPMHCYILTSSYSNCLFFIIPVFDQDVDLMKSYILKIQQLEGELMQQKFSTACQNDMRDQLAMENSSFLNDLGAGCEIETPDASSKTLKHIQTFLSSIYCNWYLVLVVDPFFSIWEMLQRTISSLYNSSKTECSFGNCQQYFWSLNYLYICYHVLVIFFVMITAASFWFLKLYSCFRALSCDNVDFFQSLSGKDMVSEH